MCARTRTTTRPLLNSLAGLMVLALASMGHGQQTFIHRWYVDASATDRLVHHSVILELNVPSYRLEAAKKARPKART